MVQKQLGTAAALSIGVSIVASVSFLALAPYWWDYKSTLIGYALGIVLGGFVGTRTPTDPAVFAPLVRKRDLRMSELLQADSLEQWWQRFPKGYAWASCFVYLGILLLKLNLPAQQLVSTPNAMMGLRGAFVGFASSVMLCPGVFYLYLLLLRKNEGKT